MRGIQGSATVLARKGKVRIFEQVVGEDDELSSLTPRALPGRAPAKRIWG
jgi:hypothetical protein